MRRRGALTFTISAQDGSRGHLSKQAETAAVSGTHRWKERKRPRRTSASTPRLGNGTSVQPAKEAERRQNWPFDMGLYEDSEALINGLIPNVGLRSPAMRIK